jgi:hypothetical protein
LQEAQHRGVPLPWSSLVHDNPPTPPRTERPGRTALADVALRRAGLPDRRRRRSAIT